jgi:nucleoside-diphosphate-sugar epimerase
MAMPDAIKALVDLASAPRENLTSHVYNITSFNPSAEEIFEIVGKSFTEAAVTFDPDWKRQAIVDTWPSDVNDNIAHRDWGWEPDFDQDRTFEEYLLPNISQRYAV